MAVTFVVGAAMAAGAKSAPARKPKEPFPDNPRYAGVFDSPPRSKFFPRTVFPPFLIEQGVSGEAIIAFRITAEGHVDETKVVEATHPAFGSAALGTVGRMVFLPAQKAGKPVSVRATVVIEFVYEEEPEPRNRK